MKYLKQSSTSNWREIYEWTYALGPFNERHVIKVNLPKQDLIEDIKKGKREKTLLLWSVILGEIPFFNQGIIDNSSAQFYFSSLLSAHACFLNDKGVSQGKFCTVAYVMNPRYFLATPSEENLLICAAELEKFPDDLLHVVTIRVNSQNGETTFDLIHFRNMKVDPCQPLLPLNYQNIFQRRLW